MSEKKTRTTVSKGRDRRILKYIVIAATVVIVGGALAFAGWRGFQVWRMNKALSSTRQLLQNKDFSQAWISAGRAVQINKSNLEANRLMAEVAETIGRENKDAGKREFAVAMRKRIVEMQPGVNENYLALAKAAVEINDYATAEEALSKLNEAGQKTADYHGVRAKLALFTGQGSQVEGHVSEAARLDPENETYQLQLAAVKLGSPVPEVRKGAIATIEQLAQNPKVRRQALRTLIQTSFATGEMDKAVGFASQLKDAPDAQFEDQMLFLNLLGRLKRHEFWWYVAQLEAGPPADDQDLANVLSWLNNHGLAAAAVALDWEKRLPEERRMRLPVAIAYAESGILLGKKEELSTLLKLSKDWGPLEFQRVALQAYLMRADNDEVGSKNTWRKAVTAAGSRPFALQALMRFATTWKWNEEQLELLWMMAKGRDNPGPALQALLRKYVAENKTREMLAVFTRMLEINPKDDNAKNNLAYTLLLLNQDWDRAEKLALEAHTANPKNPGYASTYAYAILLKGRRSRPEVEKAIKVMAEVDPEDLKIPSTALCYAILLSAQGDKPEARKYLQLANAGRLLPEEKVLADIELNNLKNPPPP